LTGNLLLADVVLLDKDGTRVFKASIAEVKNQGCPVGGLAVSTGTFWQTWFHLLTTDPEHVDSGLRDALPYQIVCFFEHCSNGL